MAIVGASGFIGRALVRELAGRGTRPVGVVRSIVGVQSVREAGGEARLGPLTDREFLGKSFEGCGAVVYLAGATRESRPGDFWRVHVEGVAASLDAARTAGVPRFILFGSLGAGGYGARPVLTNEYFRTKREGERRAEASRLPALILRPGYIIGPGDRMATVLAEGARAGRVLMRGDGAYRLQPLALADAVRAAVVGMERGITGTFDLVGPESVTHREFLDRLFAVMRRKRLLASAPDVRRVPLQERADLSPEERDILTCDEVGDPGPAVRWLGPLTSLDAALDAALLPTR
ncbi:MAG: NAD(P)H-binding protein [Halobacteria archaeon]